MKTWGLRISTNLEHQRVKLRDTKSTDCKKLQQPFWVKRTKLLRVYETETPQKGHIYHHPKSQIWNTKAKQYEKWKKQYGKRKQRWQRCHHLTTATTPSTNGIQSLVQHKQTLLEQLRDRWWGPIQVKQPPIWKEDHLRSKRRRSKGTGGTTCRYTKRPEKGGVEKKDSHRTTTHSFYILMVMIWMKGGRRRII